MSECCQKDNAPKSAHPSHDAQLKNLNRISGQVEGIKKMVADGRYCVDIITQIKAAKAALASVESKILKTHLENCVVESFSGESKADQQEKIAEILKIFARIT